MKNPCSVESTTRSVFLSKLLVALNDDSEKVAILATKKDLHVLLFALRDYSGSAEWVKNANDLADGIEQLISEAFT